MEQLTISGLPPKKDNTETNKKLRWEYGFQKWSDEHSKDGYDSLGVCGYSNICYYCSDNGYGRPCVRALNALCRANKITIDYDNKNYEEMWNI